MDAPNYRKLMQRYAIEFLENALEASWCKETASPACQEAWQYAVPSQGQCAVTALLVQDLLGGELLRTVIDGFGSHYYNRLADGEIVDFTNGQFPDEVEIPPGVPADRNAVLDSDRARAARTRERYDLLAERFESVCRDVRKEEE